MKKANFTFQPPKAPGAPGFRSGLMLLAALCFEIALGTSHSLAEGFRNPPPGSFDLGRAGGRIAQVDDSSAVEQNPANLVDLPSGQFQFSPSIVYIHADFASATGQTGSTIKPWKLLPNLFGSVPLCDGQVALGLGITVPYGLSNDWDQNSGAFAKPGGVLRYTAPYVNDLQTIKFNPSISVKLGDHFQVGAGFDTMWSQVTLKQFYPWFLFPGSTLATPDGHLEAKGDGLGYGGNIGLTWKITDRVRLAATYRSPLTVHYNGDLTVDNITPVASALGATPRSDLATKIGFPTIVSGGLGVQICDKLRLESDVEWIQFSRFKSLDLGVGNNSFLLPSTSIPQNWKDTFTAGIGADWNFATNWVLRAGYQFYQSPVPDSTFSPTIPDADQNVITVGLAYSYHHHSLEAAYGADFYATRHITGDQNPAYNGTYDFTVHLFSVAYRYSF